jgi:hypothetical protein
VELREGVDLSGSFIKTKKKASDKMIHKSASACLDVNGDEQTNFNIGLRVNYHLRISKIEFTLE